MTDDESRHAKLRGRAVRAGACSAALAAAAALTASCATAMPRTLVTTDRTVNQTGGDAARHLCDGRHASQIRLRRLVVTRHGSLGANAAGRRARVWTVTSATRMESVQRALCALPKQPPGTYFCPADFGISYQLRFYGPHGALPAVDAATSGCQLVTSLGKATRWTATSPKFWPALARAIGLPHSGRGFFTP
jgi:hypothetical protein